jgi:hypothetical protein
MIKRSSELQRSLSLYFTLENAYLSPLIGAMTFQIPMLLRHIIIGAVSCQASLLYSLNCEAAAVRFFKLFIF